MQFISQVMIAITASLVVAFLGLVWQFVKAVNEVPRLKKGMRILFERVEELEKQIKQKDNL